MTWNEMYEAIKDARETISRADLFCQQMADLFAGRLQASRVGDYTLCALKKELRGYNMNTGLWKGEA